MAKRVYHNRRKSTHRWLDKTKVMVGLGLMLIVIGVATLWAFVSSIQGPLVSTWLTFLNHNLGWAAYLIPFLLSGLGVWIIRQGGKRPWRWPWLAITGAFIVLVVALALTSLLFDNPLSASQSGVGGALGRMVGAGVRALVGQAIAIILLLLCGVTGFALVLHIPLKSVVWFVGTALVWVASLFQRLGFLAARGWRWFKQGVERKVPAAKPPASLPISQKPLLSEASSTQKVGASSPTSNPKAKDRVGTSLEIGEEGSEGGTRGVASWVLPSVADMLLVRQDSQMSLGDIRTKARIIEETLRSLGVPATVVEVNPGPVVTQFGIEPGFVERLGRDGEVQRAKVKVSRIAALSNDLALALAASPIRIEAPVPGKGIVGLEVPNGLHATVGLRGVIESPEFKAVNGKLTLALGRDVSGGAVVADLAKLPHLLVAGATNSGKSVCLNAIISCLLLHNTPDELKMVLVDPKRVELSQYNGIPHLLAPVVVERERVMSVLNWLIREMERRYRVFATVGARNVGVYNERALKNGEEKLPYIVLVMDELADLMIVSPEDVEHAVCRLAQMARATGIHLIIAVQRPSVDVVTGQIKANFPARIAFAVTSQVDSRVIIDSPGADKLLGRGDSLLMAPDSPQLARVQGCYVSEGELGRLVQFWKAQITSQPTAVTPLNASGPVIQQTLWPLEPSGGEPDQADERILSQARDVIRREGRASVTLLQRNLGIGYTRASRIIDQLEREGLIGPATGTSKAREVIMANTHEKQKE
ncbi:MAG: FtsK/SpoIIIE family DNA translocase [Anaerolineae bacterium]